MKFIDKVFEIVAKIQKGQTLTYKQVAQKAGMPRAYRPVGNILHQNRNGNIPYHRVIRSDSQASGYNKGEKEKIKK